MAKQGLCSVDLTVTNDGKPVAAADVKVHISYGFAGIRRLELEAYTGNEGKVKFTGLPRGCTSRRSNSALPKTS
jgi:hypothetical protein